MEEYRTKLNIKKSHFTINQDDQIILLGSCFAEHIGLMLAARKFNILQNPFGILYNPVSIANATSASIDLKNYTKSELNHLNGIYSNFDFHGRLNDTDPSQLLLRLNQAIKILNKGIKEAQFIIVSLGTAFVFERIETHQIVANCHKFPNSEFTRHRLTTKQIISTLANFIKKINTINKAVKLIFTISPVRHIRDGFIENNRSKSSLLLSIDSIIKQHDNCHYFPSYELLLDDLRDYRFYSNDMIHPNELAIKYIWNRFQECYMTDETINLNHQIERINKSLNHKPLFPNSKEYQQFLQNLKRDIKQFESASIQFDAELDWINNKLSQFPDAGV